MSLDFNCSKTVARYTKQINEGCVAKIMGFCRCDNPYHEGTPENQAWAHGWGRS